MSDDALTCAACGAPTYPGTVMFQHTVTCPVRLRTGKPRPDALDELLDEPPLTEVMAWQIVTSDRCKHQSIVVCNEGTDRYVECGKCEARLDPIAVLAEYAEQDRRLISTLTSVRDARAKAAEEHEQIRKATDALKRHRAATIKKNPLLAQLVALRASIAKELRGHPDQDVAMLRARLRDRLTLLVDTTVKNLETIE